MVSIDNGYQLMACTYIDGQLKTLSQEIEGAREGRDIKYVHQSRVASRRIRASLSIFANCFPAKKIKKWRKEIKKLTKAFSAARDADVQIKYLEKAITKLDVDRKSLLAGIKRILLRTRQRRRELQTKIVTTIDRLEEEAVLADIHSSVEKILFCLKNEKAVAQNEYVLIHTSDHICDRLSELLSIQNYLQHPEDKTGHHQMRIAAKRLRYTMEICGESYHGRLDGDINIVKKIQTLLGDIHDCDVWIEEIDKFKKTELQRTIDYYGREKPYYLLLAGLDYLRAQRRKERQHLFAVLVRYWKILNYRNFWVNLESKVRLPAADSNKSRFKIVEIKRGTSGEKTVQNNPAPGGRSRKSPGTGSGA